MGKKTFEQLRQQRDAANTKLGELYLKANDREELTAEEKIQEANLEREIKMCENEMRGMKLESDHAAVQLENHKREVSEQFRQMLRECKDGKMNREILLAPSGGNTSANIQASGAINLDIKEMLPTLHEGLGLPAGLKIQTGVIGDELWPVSINDVAIEEVGETTSLTAQDLNFDKIKPSSKRCGLMVEISNRAIDNASFDLLSFVMTKFDIATRIYLASRIYSQAAWGEGNNHGPFSGLTPKTITLGTEAYKNILAAVAEFSDMGFYEGQVCISMDRVTEAELKATPKVTGAAAGFVVENGLCAGYPYTVSHFVNTEEDGNGGLQKTADRYIEIGYWEWFALQQHDDVRLAVDATSKDVIKKNVTAVALNTAWSMTDLSIYINGGKPAGNPAVYPTQAFSLYKIVNSSSSDI